MDNMADNTREEVIKNAHGKEEATMIIKIQGTNRITGLVVKIINGKDSRIRKTGNRCSGIVRS